MSEYEAQIAIDWDGGTRPVPAIKSRSGALCIHLGVGDLRERWCITHVETGLRLDDFPHGYAAVQCAESIDHLDWTHWRDHETEIFAALRKWGGVRVLLFEETQG